RMTLTRCRIWLFYQRLFSGSAVTVAGGSGWFAGGCVVWKGGWPARIRPLASDAALSRLVRVTEGGGHRAIGGFRGAAASPPAAATRPQSASTFGKCQHPLSLAP